MKKYKVSKTIGVVLGTLMVIASVGYGFIYLLGTSLGSALGSTIDTTAKDIVTLGMIFSICVIGVLTGILSFGLKSKGLRMVYFGFCLLIGVALLVTYFISIGALGKKVEFLILFMGIIYFLLGYFVKKER